MKIYKTLLLMLVAVSIFGQDSTKDWFHTSISSNEAYESSLNNKKGETVIVAVIDSGVDIEHEDLAGNIWVNTGEIPGNNIDDDRNGYVDDVHGWNFIGNADGTNLGSETLEVTRLYAKYRNKYQDAKREMLTKDQQEEFDLFTKVKEEVEENQSKAKQSLMQMTMTKTFVNNMIEGFAKQVGDVPIDEVLLDTMDIDIDPQLIGAFKQIVAEYTAMNDKAPTVNDIQKSINDDLQGSIDHFDSQANYHYNPDFKSRELIGDNYNDQNEKFYGNNDVEGPDAFHGTHVSGIIGAVRGNDVGIDGVASNVKIMSIRAVPDGDEHDKDVANAIRYAVDNGASIINMSFGKGYAWNKDVVDDAVRYAEKKDVLLIHAAGNSAQDNDTTDNFPNDTYRKAKGFLFWKKKKAKSWIEVGAFSNQPGENAVASFSNYGQNDVDIFAPGVAIYSTTPDNNYRNAQGTSMAAPVVAGVAAVIRSYFPGLKAHQVKEVIMNSATSQNMKVKKPGSKDMVDFNSLSVTGSTVNLQSALKVAARTKGKKKIKKSNKRA